MQFDICLNIFDYCKILKNGKEISQVLLGLNTLDVKVAE